MTIFWVSQLKKLKELLNTYYQLYYGDCPLDISHTFYTNYYTITYITSQFQLLFFGYHVFIQHVWDIHFWYLLFQTQSSSSKISTDVPTYFCTSFTLIFFSSASSQNYLCSILTFRGSIVKSYGYAQHTLNLSATLYFKEKT